MIGFFKSLIICISMYSAVPVPTIEWEEKSLKNSLGFLPIIGLIIGAAEYLWHTVAKSNGINMLLYSAVAVIIPIMLSGGIHIDGFIDSCDAIASRADKDTRLKILSDPNVGAFGVIYFAVYLLLNLGIYSQLANKQIHLFGFMVVYGLSRAVGGLIAVYYRSAKSSGLKHEFSKSSAKSPVKIILCMWGIAFLLALSWLSFLSMIMAVGIVCIFLLYFSNYTKKHFGGITGDLIGFSITIIELLLLVSLLVGVD